jgi:hypothetical protein
VLKRYRSAAEGEHTKATANSNIKDLETVALRSRKEVAAILKIADRTLQNVERLALGKIRRKPELLKLWAQYREESEGNPRSEDDMGVLMLDWQLQVSRWYECVDHLGTIHFEKERRECEAEIARCQKALSELLARFE